MTDQASSIASHVSQCYRSFEKLRELLEKELREDINLSDVVDELGRFRVWAANIGAHRRGRMSLDFQLRDALHIKERIQSLLQDLNDKVQQAVSIILGIKIPWNQAILESDSEPDSDSADGDQSNTAENDSELRQLLRSAHEKISLLSRLSMAIRNPAPEDQYIGLVDVKNLVSRDIDYVVRNFPRISPGLADNMGNAISRRRQSFAAHKSRHAKLSRGVELWEQVDDERDTQTEHQPYTTAVASSLPEHITRNANSTYDQILEADMGSDTSQTLYDTSLPEHITRNANSTYDQILEADMGSDTSQTLYDTSLSRHNNMHPIIPRWPQKARTGKPIECPLCFMVVSVASRDSWRRHILRDLYPYLCTVADCPTPNRMFSTRHEWFQHELQAHRRVWQCAHGCPGSFGTQNQFEAHARVQHPDFTSPDILVALSNLSVVPLNGETPAECCFCHQQGLTLSKLERHLGRHQESLALFALPRIDQEDDGTDVDEEDYPQTGKCSSEEELSLQGNIYTVSEDEEIQESNAQMLSDVANLRQALPEMQEQEQWEDQVYGPRGTWKNKENHDMKQERDRQKNFMFLRFNP